ncbi:MAG TPA: DMT family transporter [Pseudonocardiaceae bacterium]|nr:DMT family transporter [Pseudonocardiaceae bacterium]
MSLVPARRLAGIGLAAMAGLALAVQARINGQFATALRTADPRGTPLPGVLAATISTGIGLVLLAVIVLGAPAGRRGLVWLARSLRTGTLSWWQCLGGVCGALLVSAQGLTVAEIGVAVYTVAVVAGQVLASLLVDRAGVGPMGPRPMTARRTLGALLTVPAVAVAVAHQFGDTRVLLLALLPLMAGVGSAWQQAVNGQVAARSGQTLVASLVNFAVAEVVLLAVLAVPLAATGLPHRWPTTWWLYTGGLLGIVLIASAATAVGLVGVLLVGLCSVAGQLAGALALEVAVPAGPLVFPVIGTVLALVAVAVASRDRS